MRKTGAREFRDHAYAYLRRAKRGESTEITVHGEVIARLIPATGATASNVSTFDDLVAQAAREGWLVPAKKRTVAEDRQFRTLLGKHRTPKLSQEDVEEAIQWVRDEET